MQFSLDLMFKKQLLSGHRYSGNQRPHYITSKCHYPNMFLHRGVMQLLPRQTHIIFLRLSAILLTHHLQSTQL